MKGTHCTKLMIGRKRARVYRRDIILRALVDLELAMRMSSHVIYYTSSMTSIVPRIVIFNIILTRTWTAFFPARRTVSMKAEFHFKRVGRIKRIESREN